MSYLLPLFQLQLMLLPLLLSPVGFLSQVCFLICLFVGFFFHYLADTFVSFYLVGYSVDTFDLGIIVSNIRQCISSHSDFRFVMRNHHFGVSSRSDGPDVLASSYLDTTYFQRWPQSIIFDCKEIRKRKGCEYSGCPFSVRIAFNRSVGFYVVKLCRFLHTCHVVNLSSIPGHARCEKDSSADERGQLENFGKIGYTGLQSKSALCRLFSGWTYDSDMIYCVVKKARTLHCGDATDYMLKLVELGN